MKAVVYKDAYDVTVQEVPDPRIEDPQDVIIKVTTTNICGSDLHMYEGRTNVEQGKVLGHENMGVVAEAGPAVRNFRPGDRVSVPFNVACGTCYNCTHGWTSFCTRTNPTEGVDGGAYGYASMGPWAGGQAEYLRVPFADFNLLALPPGTDYERHIFLVSLPIVLVARYLAFIPFGLYRGVWRYAGARDAMNIVGAVVVSEAAAFLFIWATVPWGGFPRGTYLIDVLLCSMLIAISFDK